ncbi:MAG: hypothetical protein PEPC_00408 [Peptostreptococcus russellii]
MKRDASLSMDTILSVLLISAITYSMVLSFSNLIQMNENIDDENDLLGLLVGIAEKENEKIALSSMDSLDTEDRQEILEGYNIRVRRTILEGKFGLVKSQITVLKEGSEQSLSTYSVIGASL